VSTEDKLLNELENAPETEIVGVVSAQGVTGAAHSAEDELWTLLFSFSGWRQASGVLQKSELTIRREVTKEQLGRFQDRVAPYDVLRIRARLSEHSVFGSPQALLINLLGKHGSDAELNAYAKELQEPVTFLDFQFGLFTLNRRLDWYEATPGWGDNCVRLTIPADEAGRMQESLSVARTLWAAQAEWQKKITDYAVEELLSLKNENWLEDDETAVSAEEFAQRMVLEMISIRSDGSFEFWYDDGELFWGHSIMVNGNLTDGPKDAGIHG
jgi:hypothetical protein